MKILVSGGTGLVGRYIVNGLLAAGHEVMVGARTAPKTGFFAGPVDFTPLQLDPELDQSAAFAGMDAFIHAAFDHIPGRYRGGEGDEPERFCRLNRDGSIRLFEAAKKMAASRIVFLSSRAVYDGLPAGTPLHENMPLAPTSLYGRVKLDCEAALAALSSPECVTASLRATGIYGHLRPNKWDGVIADLIAGNPVAARTGTEVHGDDVAGAVRLMLEADADLINGQCFNVSDIVVDTRAIAERLPMPVALPQPAKPTGNAMNTEKIRRIGWMPGGMRRFDETMAILGNSPQEC